MNRKNIKIALAALLVLSTQLSLANEYDIGRDSNKRSGTLHVGKATKGKIIQVRNVKIEPTSTSKTTGRAIGAIVGAGVGRSVNSRISTVALGGIVGGVVGNEVTDRLTNATAQEIIVLTDDEKIVTLTQAESDLRAGQSVYLVRSGSRTRIVLNQAEGY